MTFAGGKTDPITMLLSCAMRENGSFAIFEELRPRSAFTTVIKAFYILNTLIRPSLFYILYSIYWFYRQATKALISVQMCSQQRPWSECANVQATKALISLHMAWQPFSCIMQFCSKCLILRPVTIWTSKDSCLSMCSCILVRTLTSASTCL